MHLPTPFQEHAPLSNLYHDLQAALHPTVFEPHADQLAFRAVLHATAWLSENTELRPPYHATETSDQIFYHTHHTKTGILASDVHLTALLNGHALTRAGAAIWSSLNEQPFNQTNRRAPQDTHEWAISFWRLQLQLLTRYGLDFDPGLTADEDAA
ncbi:hypothetical protein Q0M94_24310 (plasmid) [Deinococcus radiomollis]|uniref:hypothetical protein n=1 Tax=Deinococcus radiomollis TaxID=468916 RepID=UPI003892B661